MSPGVDLAEFLPAYLAEADELLAAANASLLAIEAAAGRGEPAGRHLRELLRALHTLKGLSGMIGAEPLVDLTHRIETSLKAIDADGARVEPGSLDTLFQAVRVLEKGVVAFGERKPIAAVAPALLEALERLGEPSLSPRAAEGGPLLLEPLLLSKLAPDERTSLACAHERGKRAVRVDFFPSPARAAEGLTINTVRARVGQIGEIVKVMPLSLPSSPSAPTGLGFALLVTTSASDEALASAVGAEPGAVRSLSPAPAAAEGAREVEAPPPPRAEPPKALPIEAQGAELEPVEGGEGRGGDVVRVEIARIDRALAEFSTVLLDRARLSTAVAELAARGADTRAIERLLGEASRHLRSLRQALLRVRMVKVSDVLERLPLLVRGLRRSTGKQVRLEIDAGETELDKVVGDQIFPAVVHLVRNAVDHAIELPDERTAKGKPEEGVVRVRCVERAGARLELQVSDDGRGVDRVAVARRAGAPLPETDAALLSLLCRPGLSTRDQATTTSGRGMGMDIVRKVVVERLGGELLMTTAEGEGTTFALRVPLTISIIDAFVLMSEGERYLVPVSMVDEIVEVAPGQIIEHGTAAGARVGLLERRGRALPLVSLSAALGVRGASGAFGAKAIVVQRDGEALAFAVDRLLGKQEVVVRSMEDPLVRAPGVSGAADLGDGKLTLLLDLVSLGNHRGAARAPRGAS